MPPTSRLGATNRDRQGADGSITSGIRSLTVAVRCRAGVVLAVIVGAAVAAPLLGAWGAGIYAALGWVCHQRPERSWHLAGKPLAVCVRCFGLYAGALLALLLGGKFWRRPALGMVAVMGVDWLLETLGWVGARPWWRFGIGLVVGLLVAPALWSEQREQPIRRIG